MIAERERERGTSLKLNQKKVYNKTQHWENQFNGIKPKPTH